MAVTASLYNDQHQLVDTQTLQVKGAPINFPVGRETASWEIPVAPAQKVRTIVLTAQTVEEHQRLGFQILDPVIEVTQ